LGGQASRFQAKVGLDDSAGGKGSVAFLVIGDGKILWQSELMTGQQPAESVDVDVKNVKVLELRVTDGGNGSSNDHADWADAAIVMNAGASAPTALPLHEKFAITTKSFTLNF